MAPLPSRKVRVFYLDPDVTDSSSGDEDDEHQRKNKTVVQEILLPKKLKSTQLPSGKKPKKVPTSKYHGVWLRQSGRWAAEIRDPVRKIRVWIGTFGTEEEAHLAYQAAAMQLLGEAPLTSAPVSTSAPMSTSVLAMATACASVAFSCLSSSSEIAEKTQEEEKPLLAPAVGMEESAWFEKLEEDVLTDEDFIGLPDISDLPLPFTDEQFNLDMDNWDFSFLNVGP